MLPGSYKAEWLPSAYTTGHASERPFGAGSQSLVLMSTHTNTHRAVLQPAVDLTGTKVSLSVSVRKDTITLEFSCVKPETIDWLDWLLDG